MTLIEIENLLQDMFENYGVIKCHIIDINKRDDNSLFVNFILQYEDKTTLKTNAIMTPSYIQDEGNAISNNMNYKYKQYMIAKGYSEY